MHKKLNDIKKGTSVRSLLNLTGGELQPAAWLDLDAFERNRDRMFKVARNHGVQLRLASKSIRVPELMRQLIDQSEGLVRGVLTYSPAETAYLAAAGFKDLLLAYPVGHRAELEALRELLLKTDHKITLMVDHPDHIELLSRAAFEWKVSIRVCLDVDASMQWMGQHLGVYRSSVHTLAEFEERVDLMRVGVSRAIFFGAQTLSRRKTGGG